MKNCLVLTGNEVCHNYFINMINNNCTNYNFTIMKVASGKNDFEYFFPTYSKGLRNNQKKEIIEFIFNRNKTLCRNEKFEMLKSPDKQLIVNNSQELHNYLDKLLQKESFDLALTFSSPIIKNKKILDMLSFNLHFGLSRFYRGGISNISALAENEMNKIGATCHELKPSIDGGKVLFEIQNVSAELFNSIDEINYYILRKSLIRLIERLKQEDFNTYTIPKGELVLIKKLTAGKLIKAEKNLREFTTSNN